MVKWLVVFLVVVVIGYDYVFDGFCGIVFGLNCCCLFVGIYYDCLGIWVG